MFIYIFLNVYIITEKVPNKLVTVVALAQGTWKTELEEGLLYIILQVD